MAAWGSGFSHPGGSCQLTFLWWLIGQYWASSINTGWVCLAGQRQYFSYCPSEILTFLWEKEKQVHWVKTAQKKAELQVPTETRWVLRGAFLSDRFLKWHWITLPKYVWFPQGAWWFQPLFHRSPEQAKAQLSFLYFSLWCMCCICIAFTARRRSFHVWSFVATVDWYLKRLPALSSQQEIIWLSRQLDRLTYIWCDTTAYSESSELLCFAKISETPPILLFGGRSVLDCSVPCWQEELAVQLSQYIWYLPLAPISSSIALQYRGITSQGRSDRQVHLTYDLTPFLNLIGGLGINRQCWQDDVLYQVARIKQSGFLQLLLHDMHEALISKV